MNDKALVKLDEITTSLKRQNFHPSRELAITLVSAAHHALLTAKSNGDTAAAHEVRKKLKTIEDWFKLQRARLIDSNLVVAERLRAERVVGGMLPDDDRKGRGKKGGANVRNSFHNEMNSLLNIEPRDKMNWKRENKISDADFEQWVIDQTQAEQEISTAALLRLWREGFGESPETPDLPDSVFQVLYADPPWDYSNSGFNQSAAQHYSTMPTPDICSLKDKRGRTVNDIAANDSVLFLWVTSPLLPDGLEVMEAWGFEYKADMIWIKDRAPGVGWWVRTKHEILLIGSRGSFLPETMPDSVVEAPVGRHSDKPDTFYEIIESMYPESKRAELFARDPRDGWTAWGNEL